MLYSLLSPLSSFFKVKDVDIYSAIFKLHTKLTVYLLVSFSLIVSANQYFGDPINCITDPAVKDSIEIYCWIFGTYISKKAYEGKMGVEILHTGIASNHVPPEDRNYQKYYQWVPFIFILQAILFYLPAYMWKLWEGGRLKAVCSDLVGPMINANSQVAKRRVLRYLRTLETGTQILYAIRYLFCEICNFIIVLVNIIFVNLIFSEFWFSYSPAIQSLLSETTVDQWQKYSSRLFPKIAKCDFFSYGPSGSMQKKDALCILPLNIINEKLFAIVWIWFIILAIVSALNIVYKLVVWSCPCLRVYLLVSTNRTLHPRMIRIVTDNANIGEWFFLYKMSSNMNHLVFADIIRDMHSSMTNKSGGKNVLEINKACTEIENNQRYYQNKCDVTEDEEENY